MNFQGEIKTVTPKELRSEKYTSDPNIWTYGDLIVCKPAKIQQVTERGVEILEHTAKQEQNNPNQAQVIVAVGPLAHDCGARPGQVVFIRRDLFIPRYKIANEEYDQPSVYQISLGISQELKDKHDNRVRANGGLIKSAYGDTMKEAAQKKF